MNKLKKIFLTAVATLTVATVSAAGEEPAAESYRNNRHPLLQKDYIQLPLGTIRAEGWMHDQLTRMRDGMTGHLDKVYTKVMGPRNGWLGGDGDVWERGPYWIDGLLPLAYLLNDQALIEKVQPWIEWTLASQKPNGYFGPDTDRDYEPGLQRNNAQDWWPKMVMLKVMQQYYTATQDRRVIDFMTRYFRYQLDELPKNPLGKWTFWGEQRGGDNLMVVYWLYNITGDKFLLDLGELIHKQTFNWTDIFLNQNHLRRQHSLHCVNLAQGFKEPIVYYQQGKDSKQIQATRQAVNDIRHTIGLPTGLWGGDELLRFGKPTTGSELCTAVEMMYSLETILEVTGDMQWADYLERVAYNALPTQVTDDYSARQYYQQTNQIAVTGRREREERLHRRIQIVDHRHVDIALAVVRHREGAVLHLRIGNRTVGVGHAQHGRHAQDTGQLVNGPLAAGLGLDLEVVAVEIGECLLENIVVEFVRRIVGSDVLSLVGLHGRGVTAQFVGHKHVVHLRSIDLKMGDELHHRGKKNAHADVVAIQVVVRRAERFGIVIFEITGAGRGGEHGHTSRKTAEPTNYSVCFHLGQDFRIVTSR